MSAHVEARRLCELARQALKEGRLQEALTYARQASSLEPDGEETHALVGIALCQNGMTAEGIDSLRAAVGLNPRNTNTRSNLAMAYQKAGRWDSAVAEWREILRQEPANSRAQAALHAAEQKLAESGGQPAATAWAAPQQPAAQDGAWSPLLPSPPPVPPPQQPAYGQPQQFGYGPPPPTAPGYPPGATPPPAGPYAPPPPPPPGVYTPGYGGPPPPLGTPYAAPVGDDTGGWSLENIMAIITSPVSFMASQRGQMGFWPPIAFYAVNMLIASGIGFVIALVNMARMASSLPASGLPWAGMGAGAGTVFGLCGLAIIIPIAIGLMFVGAAIVHLFVMMVRGQGYYSATFRACIYATLPGALIGVLVHLLRLVPGAASVLLIMGALQWAGWIWGVAILAIGLREMHAISTGAAVFAAAAPFVLSMLLTIGLLVAFLMPVLSKSGATPPWWSMFSRGSPSISPSGTTSSPGATTSPGAPSPGTFRGPYMGPSGP